MCGFLPGRNPHLHACLDFSWGEIHQWGISLGNKWISPEEKSEIPCKGIFIAIGHVPNTSAFEGLIPLDENGYFVPESGSMVKTAVPGVFVAGDCADHVYRQAITAAGMGCQSAIEAERWLAENK